MNKKTPFLKSRTFFNLAMILIYLLSLVIGLLLKVGDSATLSAVSMFLFVIGLFLINFADPLARLNYWFKVANPEQAEPGCLIVSLNIIMGGLFIIASIILSFVPALLF